MTKNSTQLLLFGILLIVFSQTHILTTVVYWLFFNDNYRFTIVSGQLADVIVRPLDGIVGVAGLVVGAFGFFRKQAE